ncbi:ASCH domain-containing protein [Bacillus badius]|uniref:ASCH domain-containing protein n=1 Tax=Bacillus badius TaxID=1455 RepID=UPI00059779A4|nr:ASCH domain-containing protein [Bacillus badius]MED4715357.1 ASCH domain-containing protein [Bacillus badius]
MKAITIKQPWATLIALREKQFETRSWQTKYRGEIAIHAGKSIDKEAYNDFSNVLKKHGITAISQLPTGSVIATANIVDCHKVIADDGSNATMHTRLKISGNEYCFGNYEEGRYAWELDNVKILPEPIKAKGQLSLWEWRETI